MEANIRRLENLGIDTLRMRWREQLDNQPPRVSSTDILRRLMAWRLQAQVLGDLDAETLKVLKRAQGAIAKGKPLAQANGSRLRTGTVLVREWRGVMHRVLVLDDGFEHEGQRYRSLSEVARRITGTRWSGPRLFGLDHQSAPSTAKAKPISAQRANPTDSARASTAETLL